MKIKTGILILFLSIVIYGQPESTISYKIDSLFSISGLRSPATGIQIFNLTDSSEIYTNNNKILFRPASNLKILTSSAGLLFLGPDYNFETSVFKIGSISDSVLYGSIYIKGGFDPTFTFDDLDTLIQNIKTSGIKEIRGNLFTDVSSMDSLYWGHGWMWDDDPSQDAPRLTPLNINENTIKVITSPGQSGGKAMLSLLPPSEYFEIENHSVTIDTGRAKLKVTRDWLNHSDKIILTGTIDTASSTDTTTINIGDPVKYFQQMTLKKLNEIGITFAGISDTITTPGYADKIYSHKTKYADIINHMNKESDNLYAEMALRALGEKFYGTPSSAIKGIKMIDSLIVLALGGSIDYRIVDGSGLSHYNLISNDMIISVIKFFYYQHPDLYKLLTNSFPVSGTDGTLKDRLKDEKTKGRVFAKTGTLSAVSTLSGIIGTDNGKEIAFSIFVNNFTGSAKRARDFQDNLVKILIDIYQMLP